MKFLDMELSPNAEKLWLKIEPEISTTVDYDILREPAIPQVQFLPRNRALVTVCGDIPQSEFEALLFHELLHIWQSDTGFKHLVAIDRGNAQIAMMLNSLVLDENIYFILEGYKIRHSKKMINMKYERLKAESKNPCKGELYYLIQCSNVGLAGSTVKGDCLANLFQPFCENFKLKYTKIVQLMRCANFRTEDGCNQTFCKLLEVLNLIETMRLTPMRRIH